MDRLHAVILSALVLAACGESSAPPAPRSRVVAVAADDDVEVEALCDVTPEGADAPVFAFPELASGAAPAPSGPRWINVWATWCAPCVEELPMLLDWAAKMRGEDIEIELVFLSADASEEAIATFRDAHPEAPETLRVADPQTLPEWVTTIGLDGGATLPIHILTDAEGKVRCARTGAVDEDDYERMRELVRSL